jgi:hypothetical protein
MTKKFLNLECVGVHQNYLIHHSFELFLRTAELVFLPNAVTKELPNLECVGMYKCNFVLFSCEWFLGIVHCSSTLQEV